MIGVDIGGERADSAVVWINERMHIGVEVLSGDRAVLEIADVVHELAERFTIAECTFDMAVDRLEWAETEDDEPVVMVEKRAIFTRMADGAADLTGPIPNTPKIGVAALLQPPAVTSL